MVGQKRRRQGGKEGERWGRVERVATGGSLKRTSSSSNSNSMAASGWRQPFWIQLLGEIQIAGTSTLPSASWMKMVNQ